MLLCYFVTLQNVGFCLNNLYSGRDYPDWLCLLAVLVGLAMTFHWVFWWSQAGNSSVQSLLIGWESPQLSVTAASWEDYQILLYIEQNNPAMVWWASQSQLTGTSPSLRERERERERLVWDTTSCSILLTGAWWTNICQSNCATVTPGLGWALQPSPLLSSALCSHSYWIQLTNSPMLYSNHQHQHG